MWSMYGFLLWFVFIFHYIESHNEMISTGLLSKLRKKQSLSGENSVCDFQEIPHWKLFHLNAITSVHYWLCNWKVHYKININNVVYWSYCNINTWNEFKLKFIRRSKGIQLIEFSCKFVEKLRFLINLTYSKAGKTRTSRMVAVNYWGVRVINTTFIVNSGGMQCWMFDFVDCSTNWIFNTNKHVWLPYASAKGYRPSIKIKTNTSKTFISSVVASD